MIEKGSRRYNRDREERQEPESKRETEREMEREKKKTIMIKSSLKMFNDLA